MTKRKAATELKKRGSKPHTAAAEMIWVAVQTRLRSGKVGRTNKRSMEHTFRFLHDDMTKRVPVERVGRSTRAMLDTRGDRSRGHSTYSLRALRDAYNRVDERIELDAHLAARLEQLVEYHLSECLRLNARLVVPMPAGPGHPSAIAKFHPNKDPNDPNLT